MKKKECIIKTIIDNEVFEDKISVKVVNEDENFIYINDGGSGNIPLEKSGDEASIKVKINGEKINDEIYLIYIIKINTI